MSIVAIFFNFLQCRIRTNLGGSIGTLHHVMVRGIEKRRLVDDETDRRNFVRRFGALAEETRTPIYAWASMSNHVHHRVEHGSYLMSGYWGAENLWSAFLEMDARALRQHAARRGNRYAERIVAEECKKSGVSLTELRNGSRRGRLPAVRTKITE